GGFDSRLFPDGNYSLYARAYDSNGASTDSAPISITLQNNQTPVTSATMFSPQAGTVASGTTFPPHAAFSLATGTTPVKVKFFIDNAYVGQVLNFSLNNTVAQMTWNTTTKPNGSHTASASITDSNNTVANSSLVTFTVQN